MRIQEAPTSSHRDELTITSDEHPALEQFVEKAGQLYTLPTVAVEILKLTGQPKVEIAALKKCLSRDPALIGKILRVVNSSLFGLSREVCDLNQALALLGTKTVRLLVLGFSLPDELFLGLAADVLHRYWHHAAIKATAAREISESIYKTSGDEPFIAGLLQDLGMLVLMQQVGEPYVRFLSRAFAKAVDVCDAEQVTLGFDHVQLTANLLKHWGLPEAFVNAIGAGHSAQRIAMLPSSQQALPQILHLADLLAAMLVEGRADWLGRLLHVGQQYHQLTGSQLTSLVGTLQPKVKQLSEVLSLELPPGVDYESIYHEAHRNLSIVAEDAAIDLAILHGSASASGRISKADDEDALLTETAELADAIRLFAHETHKTSAPAPATVRNSSARTSALRQRSSKAKPKETAPKSSDSTEKETFLARVSQSIAECRDARRPLSLILVEIDGFATLSAGIMGSDSQRILQLVGLVCGKVDHPRLVQMRSTNGRLTLVLPDCDRSAAAVFGHRILDDIRRLNQRQPELAKLKLSVSVGVSTVGTLSKHFPAQKLIDSADRCLQAAQMSGGNTLKSIDVL